MIQCSPQRAPGSLDHAATWEILAAFTESAAPGPTALGDKERQESRVAAEELRAEIASKDQELAKARGEEKKAREERRWLEEEKDAWDLEKVRMRDEITPCSCPPGAPPPVIGVNDRHTSLG